MSLLDDMNAKRLRAWEQTKEILERANSENRDLTGEEESAYQSANEDLNRIDARIRELIDAAERQRDSEAAMERLNIQAQETRADEDDSELRQFVRGERQSLEVRIGKQELRDLTSGTDSSDGAAVPVGFAGMLYAYLIETATVAQVCTLLNTAGGEPFDVPVTTSHSSGALTSESAAITESDPAFARRQLSAYKYATAFEVPNELLQDTGVDLEGYLAMQAGRAVGNALGVHLATGTGSSQPAGIVTGSTAGKTGANSVSGAFTADNLIDLYHSVIGVYRNSPKCGWMMRDASLGALRKLTDAASQYIWQPSLSAGAPDTLFAKPIYTDPNIAAIGLSAKSVIFGDLGAYITRLAGGIRFERSDHYSFNKDQVAYRAIVRGDGILADQTGAVKHFVGGSS